MGLQAITAGNREKTPEFSPRNPGEIPDIFGKFPEILGNAVDPYNIHGATGTRGDVFALQFNPHISRVTRKPYVILFLVCVQASNTLLNVGNILLPVRI